MSPICRVRIIEIMTTAANRLSDRSTWASPLEAFPNSPVLGNLEIEWPLFGSCYRRPTAVIRYAKMAAAKRSLAACTESRYDNRELRLGQPRRDSMIWINRLPLTLRIFFAQALVTL